MERYIDVILGDPNLFISNYIVDGAVDNIHGLDKINGYVHDIYPFLSIEYLLRANGNKEGLNAFREKYGAELAQELQTLIASIGETLQNSVKESSKDLQRLTMRVEQLEREKDTLSHILQETKANLQEAKAEIKKLRQQLKGAELKTSKRLFDSKTITYLFCHFYKPLYCSPHALISAEAIDYNGFINTLHSEFGVKLHSKDFLACSCLNDALHHIMHIQGGEAKSHDDEKTLSEIRPKYSHSVMYVPELTDRVLTSIIVRCCPLNKSFFESDCIERIGLDASKLKVSLMGFGYNMDWEQVLATIGRKASVKLLKLHIRRCIAQNIKKEEREEQKVMANLDSIPLNRAIEVDSTIAKNKDAIKNVKGKNKNRKRSELLKGMGIDD